MKAGVLYEPLDLRVEERPDPRYGPEDLLIQVTYNGLCGTDVTEYTKGPMMVPLSTQHLGSGHLGPTILGHEFIGAVVEAGARVRHRIGERVACGAGVSCGHCRWCLEGRTNLCASYYTLGLSTHGGLAEFVAAPSSICVAIPDGCDDLDASLAQPLAVGIHSMRRAGIRRGDAVALLGAGAIGSFILAALSEHDGPVIAFDVDESRLEVARALGATQTVKISPIDGIAELRDAMPNGAEVVFETAGVQGSAERAFGLAARGGNVVLVGLNKTPQPLVLSELVLREVNVQTTLAHVCGTDIPEALRILGRLPLSQTISVQVVSLVDVVAQGFTPLSQGALSSKVLVAPHDI